MLIVVHRREGRGRRVSGRLPIISVPRSRNLFVRIRILLIDSILLFMVRCPSRFHRPNEVLECHHRRERML